jgi:hypothetical protein
MVISANQKFVDLIGQLVDQKIGDALNPETSETAQALNSIVKVERVNNPASLTCVQNAPRGLLKLVGKPYDQVDPSPLPDSTLINGQSFVYKKSHDITMQDVFDELAKNHMLVGETTTAENSIDFIYQKLLVNNDDNVRIGLESILIDLVNRAGQSLAVNAINTIKNIQASVLKGNVVLPLEGGGTVSINSILADNGTASPLWSTAATATPTDNMQELKALLQAHPDNNEASLLNGTTLLTEQAFDALKKTTQWVNYFGTGGTQSIVRPFEEYVSMFNTLELGVLRRSRSGDGYLADDGTFTSFLPTNKIWQASWTETQANGLPPVVLRYSGTPLYARPTEDTVYSTTASGVTVALVTKRKSGKFMKKEIRIEMCGFLSQFYPIGVMTVL